MAWIQNVSMSDVAKGLHYAVKPNNVLIQIVDPDMEFPVPKYNFKEVHQFKFLDVEAGDDVMSESDRCSPEQAKQIVNILRKAQENNSDVVVHCVAGVCRSGAVCEVGVMMGFDDTGVWRIPNLLVKHLLMKELGWTYE